jgi:hypothetical protein
MALIGLAVSMFVLPAVTEPPLRGSTSAAEIRRAQKVSASGMSAAR